MSPAIEIRPFANDEWRTYRDLRLASLADSPDSFGSRLEETKLRPDDVWQAHLTNGAHAGNDLPLVALADGLPVGLSWGRIETDFPETAHLYQVWVAPEARGRGIGRKMVETVIAWATQRGADVLELGVTTTNLAAVQLYTNLSFVPIGEPAPLRHGSDLLSQEMRLNLK